MIMNKEDTIFPTVKFMSTEFVLNNKPMIYINRCLGFYLCKKITD